MPETDPNPAKEELFRLLDAQSDLPEQFRKVILMGRIDGTNPTVEITEKNGDCGCLYAWGKWYTHNPELYYEKRASAGRDLLTPSLTSLEGLVIHVTPGETPDTSEPLATVVQWIDEYRTRKGAPA